MYGDRRFDPGHCSTAPISSKKGISGGVLTAEKYQGFEKRLLHESPGPEIRQDRCGITKNTLFHVYLSLFIIPDASRRPPDDFLKIDFFEKPDF